MLYKRGNMLKEAHARIDIELAVIDELTGAAQSPIHHASPQRRADARPEEATHSVRSPSSISTSSRKSMTGSGHPVGDEALRSFAMALIANIRDVDRLGRYGGEEFLLVSSGCLARSMPQRWSTGCDRSLLKWIGKRFPKDCG